MDDFVNTTFERLILQIGIDNFNTLQKSTILVLGVGGVGSYAVESLARSGIGNIIVVDFDTIDTSNINRQIPALTSTVGKNKVDVIATRIEDINPHCNIIKYPIKYNKDSSRDILNNNIDFVIDACDDISAKLHIIKECITSNIPIISSMGMGNKLHPELIKISELSKTKYDPLSRVMRKKVKDLGIKGKIPVVYSEEVPIINTKPVSSNAFVPATAGLYCGSYVINNLIKM